MADRPILFSAPMVCALLDGRKTQTRRVLKPLKGLTLADLIKNGDKSGNEYRCRRDQVQEPKFAIGDRLYVREAHYLTDDGHDEYAVYSADGTEAVDEHLEEVVSLERRHPSVDWSRHKKQRPGIHMPRWASRLTLLVTDVRVERLQDISREDAIAEGLTQKRLASVSAKEMGCDWGFEGDDRYGSPISAYVALWNHINGAGAWDENPWVCVIEFQTIHKNIDEVTQNGISPDTDRDSRLIGGE